MVEATVVVVQIEEGKTYGGTLQKQPPVSPTNIVPSQRRQAGRRPSLIVSVDQQNQLDSRFNQLNITEKIENERRDSYGAFDPNLVYEPPAFALMYKDTNMPPPVTRDRLDVDEFPLKAISTAWIKIMTQGLSEWIKLPIIVCRGTGDG